MRFRFLQATMAPLGALGVVAAALGLASCGGDSGNPVGPANHRTYRFTTYAIPSVPDDTIEVRTRGGTWRAVTDRNGQATISIPDSVALPAALMFTADHPDFLPVGSEVPGAPGTSLNVTVPCEASPVGTELLRHASLVRLGDGVADPGSADAFQVDPDGVELNVTFELTELPAVMPRYRVKARGLQCQVGMFINGRWVGGFGPAPLPDDNLLWEGPLQGFPSQVFQVGTNTFTLRTSGIQDAPERLDDIEISALRVGLP